MRRAVTAVAFALGCGRGTPAPSPDATAKASVPSAAAAPSATAAAALSASTMSGVAPGPCRALGVTGSARFRSGKPIAALTPLDGVDWVELDAGAEVSVRHGRSARELILKGPLRALPCRGGLEELVVSEGRVQSVAGTGVRPGAEVLIATPFGAARYGDAGAELSIERDRLVVVVERGDVWVDTALGARPLPADGRVRAKGRAVVRGKPDASALVRACEDAAKEAQSGAKLVLSGGPGSLGERARAQLVQRRSARGRCGVAAAAVERVDAEATRARLGDQIAAAERTWRAIPAPAAASSR